MHYLDDLEEVELDQIDDVVSQFQDEQEEQEFFDSQIDEAEKRIEEANLFKLLIQSEIFTEGSARPTILNSVNGKIKQWATEELYVLLGLRQTKATRSAESFFDELSEPQKENLNTILNLSQLEMSALLLILSKVTKKPEVETKAEPALNSIKTQPEPALKQPTLKAQPALKTQQVQSPAPKPQQKAPAKPAPTPQKKSLSTPQPQKQAKTKAKVKAYKTESEEKNDHGTVISADRIPMPHPGQNVYSTDPGTITGNGATANLMASLIQKHTMGAQGVSHDATAPIESGAVSDTFEPTF